MTRQSFTSVEAPAPSAAYSQVAQVGNVAWAAGQAGLDPVTRQFVSDDIAGQTRQALHNLRVALAGAGITLERVVRVGVYLADLDDRAAMNSVYEGFFGDPPPARTTVGASLPPGMLVEIDAMAIVG